MLLTGEEDSSQFCPLLVHTAAWWRCLEPALVPAIRGREQKRTPKENSISLCELNSTPYSITGQFKHIQRKCDSLNNNNTNKI